MLFPNVTGMRRVALRCGLAAIVYVAILAIRRPEWSLTRHIEVAGTTVGVIVIAAVLIEREKQRKRLSSFERSE
jgi:hypothetical protein